MARFHFPIRGDVLHNPGLGYAVAMGMVVIIGISILFYSMLQRRSERWLRSGGEKRGFRRLDRRVATPRLDVTSLVPSPSFLKRPLSRPAIEGFFSGPYSPRLYEPFVGRRAFPRPRVPHHAVVC